MNTPARYDIYAFIHKGLRAFMAHTLVRVGRLDAHDPAEVAEVSEEVRALVTICRDHVRHENDVIHVAMQSRAPGRCARVAADHDHHLASLDALEAQLAQVPGDAAATQAFYHALGRFVAENFEHMEREETEHNEVLWATHSDDEIRELEHRIIGDHTPQQMQLAMRWMLPHMTPGERAAMLGGMRAHAPTEAFEGVLSLIRPLLGGRDWRKLAVALGL